MYNYRAITISPTISKIFEQCLLLRFNCYYSTSELQCGFKAKVGCNEALAMFCNTVEYFTSNGFIVKVAALDMSKAFDKVDHCALFLKLIQRGLPRCFIILLMDWYSKVYVGVTVCHVSSSLFQVFAKVVFCLQCFL